MLRPPQHRADAPIVFIHPADEAWDQDRINQDCKDKPDHPVQQYFGGHTRYDLTPQVIEYLKPDSQPTKFYLRRLDWEKWGVCRSKWETSIVRGEPRQRDAYVYACTWGLERVEGIELNIDPLRGLQWQDKQKLYELSTDDIELLYDVGLAVYQASLPLSEAEKKA